jgi:2-polyprenyl-3-methyl-5-hydroxy-6-metoxy-1,4-benzoquinol methylase
MSKSDYFELRGVDSTTYQNFFMPNYLVNILTDKAAKILDFGCGFGQMMFALKQSGIESIEGADINEKALNHLARKGMVVHDLLRDVNFYDENAGKFDFIIMSHVLEHIPKNEVINLLVKLRGLLKNNGGLIVMVPNAQSNTGCYWAYEDYTHHQLFTAGSLAYVLEAAGFTSIEFIDTDCTAGSMLFKKVIRKFLLFLYSKNITFWNKVTGSHFHEPSKLIFSYEIKVLARV